MDMNDGATILKTDDVLADSGVSNPLAHRCFFLVLGCLAVSGRNQARLAVLFVFVLSSICIAAAWDSQIIYISGIGSESVSIDVGKGSA